MAPNASKSFAASSLAERSGYLNTPSADSQSDFAYNGGPLERVVFITPAFISILMITFVTFWGACFRASDSHIHLLLRFVRLGEGHPLGFV